VALRVNLLRPTPPSMHFDASAVDGSWEAALDDGYDNEEARAQGAGLECDFYREPEVVRGVSLCAGVVPVFAGRDQDYEYKQIRDVESSSSSWGKQEQLHVLSPWCGCPLGAPMEEPSGMRNLTNPVGSDVRFGTADTPPHVPDDASFHFEATTLFLPSGGPTPSEAGNRLLDFLGGEVAALVTKVNPKKFTIKAEALCQGRACDIKVRGYQQASGCAFEFQRQSGDTVSFNNLFRQASQYLLDPPRAAPSEADASAGGLAGEVTPGSPRALEIAPPPNSSEGSADTTTGIQNSLTPLLDMVDRAEDGAALQVEAAAGLAAAARDPEAVAQFCTRRACTAVRKILQSDCFGVTCPGALLLLRLSQHPEADSCFVDRAGLLHTMLERVWDPTAGEVFWEQLAREACRILARSGERLPIEAAGEAARVLSDALAWRVPGTKASASICRHLEEALECLRARSAHAACALDGPQSALVPPSSNLCTAP